MMVISQEKWIPVGVDSLEDVANDVIRIEQNSLVTAGPGAGKTELLAQKACFLFQTGKCPPPCRILAISFKRDAAKNLKERVKLRCGDLSSRFDSFTLDAFAKSLVDRFLPALDEDWRPMSGYEVMVRPPQVQEMRGWLDNAGVPEKHKEIDFRSWENSKVVKCFERMAYGEFLPYSDEGINDLIRYWGLMWWREQLAEPVGNPSLLFPMLSRLAALLLRENPKITNALRTTYSHVLLDEFQDTTASQYDLITSAFNGSSSLLTAVGDDKQRIMRWAGAMPDIFEIYEKDFTATTSHLVSNYRSAPELTQMQHAIAQAIEPGILPAKAKKTDSSGSCIIMEFNTPEEEAVHLASMISEELKKGKKTRELCVLVRQRTDEMIKFLKPELATLGIKIRDESKLQDILAEPIANILLAILRLATRNRDPEAWEILTREVALLFGIEENQDIFRVEKISTDLVNHAKNILTSGEKVTTLLAELIEMVGNARICSVYRQYNRSSFMSDVVENLSVALHASLESTESIKDAVNDLIGVDTIPAMTIHKSKGLEFSTVIFLGLDDSQWWSFANQPEEEMRNFFVAFSRAIDKVCFTFADERDVVQWGSSKRRSQNRVKINDLYEILNKAGVTTVDCRDNISIGTSE